MLIYGYQYSITGVFGYEYYENGRSICAISGLVIPNEPVGMYGWGLSWRTDFDPNITIVPGQRFPIVNSESGKKEAEIIAKTFSTYSLSWQSEQVTVAEEKNTLNFIKNGRSVAVCRRSKRNEAPTIELYGESVKARYAVNLASGISNEIKLLILAFPSLGLGIPSRTCFAL